MLVSPVSIPTWSSENLYFGYIPAHVPHNPTQIALKPFALLFFLFALRAFSPQHPGWKVTALAFIFGLLSTLSKPSYAICLLPAVGFLSAYRLYRGEVIHWHMLILGVALPVLAVLAWQYFFHRSGLGGFAFDPLRVMLHYSPGLPLLVVKFMLSILFPACVVIAYFSAARHNLALQLAWLAFATGAAYTYLLIEPSDWPSGNFWWSGQITLFILFVASTLFFIRQNTGAKTLDGRFYGCAAALALHLVSGLFWYSIQVTQGIYAWW